MSYKATTNIFTSGERYFAGNVISDEKYNALHPVAKTRFVKIEEDISLQPPGPIAASSKADEEHPSAGESITDNPDRQHMNSNKKKSSKK
jgi:hypothetical protein